ncbi:MAG: small multi-drug export protein [Candidatus Thermoplasmatota archaeon]|nr:small multi-drug export protein [Candidatus Thermoplasmatota archaeon]
MVKMEIKMMFPRLVRDAYNQFQSIKNNLGILYKFLIFVTPFLTIAYYFIFILDYLPGDVAGAYGALTVAYLFPPAGKESIIPAMLASGIPPWVVWGTMIIMDIVSAVIIAYNWWFPESIIKHVPLLDRGYELLHKKAEKFRKRKLLTLSLVLFMVVPLQGSGGISTPILARLLGINAKKTIMIVFTGSSITTTLFILSWLGILDFLKTIL